MLLNIGPRPDGRIAPADEDVLRDLGLWMMLYGEAVRGGPALERHERRRCLVHP